MTPHRLTWLAAITILSMMCFVTGMAHSDEAPGRRIVPVKNVVPKGAQPIQGNTVKVVVVDAVDLGKTLKVAVRITSTRKERVRCSLQLYFDDKAMRLQGASTDLKPEESDLELFVLRSSDGNGATQLSKLRAEASNIRIGD